MVYMSQKWCVNFSVLKCTHYNIISIKKIKEGLILARRLQLHKNKAFCDCIKKRDFLQPLCL